jgi:hypothetical protein
MIDQALSINMQNVVGNNILHVNGTNKNRTLQYSELSQTRPNRTEPAESCRLNRTKKAESNKKNWNRLNPAESELPDGAN